MSISGTPEAVQASFGIWAPWTPTLTNITLGAGTVVAEYTRVGGTVFYMFKFTFGAGSAMGTEPEFSPPVAVDTNTFIPIGYVYILDADGADWPGGMARINGTAIRLRYLNGNSNDAAITATVPMTWASGDMLICSGFYRVA
jgi:hypothetical protein